MRMVVYPPGCLLMRVCYHIYYKRGMDGWS
jgi:hypothetical protein